MSHTDLCFAWNWEYDRDFTRLLEAACAKHGLTFQSVTPANLDQAALDLSNDGTTCTAFFDRAAESDPGFIRLVEQMRSRNVYQVNPVDVARWASNKANMHQEFSRRGLETPRTLLLPAFAEQAGLPPLDLDWLGGRFAIKPASMGGGVGVVLEAGSMDEVLSVRQQYPQEKYLLQAHITPMALNGRPAWFRVLVCEGAAYACWWDQLTHIYTPVLAEERFRYGLRGLYDLARQIAVICRLQLFSTEIALGTDGRLVVVDYVNDPVDLRLQSSAVDGVPDVFVERICGRLARLVDQQRNNRKAGFELP